VFDDSVDYPIIFIHGFWGDLESWAPAIEKIKDKDPQYKDYEMYYEGEHTIWNNYDARKCHKSIWNVSYYESDQKIEIINGNIEKYSRRLSLMIDIILRFTNYDKVVIIAHSMGGLVAKKYMTSSEENWDKVFKLLTVGTPHEGVHQALKIFDLMSDLKAGSKFLNELEKDWKSYTLKNPKQKKLGVIGAIDDTKSGNKRDDINSDDNAAAGCSLVRGLSPILKFITISSAIPYDESKISIGNKLGKSTTESKNFGFRLAVIGRHTELQSHEAIIRGLRWALSKEY